MIAATPDLSETSTLGVLILARAFGVSSIQRVEKQNRMGSELEADRWQNVLHFLRCGRIAEIDDVSVLLVDPELRRARVRQLLGDSLPQGLDEFCGDVFALGFQHFRK